MKQDQNTEIHAERNVTYVNCDVNLTKQLQRERYTNPRGYWRTIKERRPIGKEYVTLEQYEEHFRRLSNADSTDIVLNIGQYYMSDPILDAKFTVGEVQIGIRHLRRIYLLW